MNKLTAIAFLACICLAASQVRSEGDEYEDESVFEEDSQLSLAPSDTEEVAGLEGTNLIFSDFCLSTRDYVLGDLKQTTNSLAASGFALFFNSAESVYGETLNTQRKATIALSDQIRNPETPIQGLNSTNELDAQIAEKQQNIQRAKSLPQSVFEAVGGILKASGNTLAQNVIAKLNQLRSVFGLMQIVGALNEACYKVSEFESEIRRKFNEAKDEIISRDASVKSVELEQVNCLTSKRITRVEGLCRFARIAHSPLMKMLTYRQK